MKKLFIIANWKSNKNAAEAKMWFESISKLKTQISERKEKTVIICPPFTLLPYTQNNIQQLHLQWYVGAQNISPFKQGAYTGEVNASQVKEFGEYTILGHSERRDNFQEDDDLLIKKVELAVQYGLIPIFCIQGVETPIPKDVILAAYEPVFAIGTGVPDTPENAESVIKAIKKKNPHVKYVLYGGSVTGDNVRSFTGKPLIDGVLVGGASLDPKKFADIVKNS